MNSNTNFSLSSWNYGAYSNSNPYFHQGVRPISAQYLKFKSIFSSRSKTYLSSISTTKYA